MPSSSPPTFRSNKKTPSADWLTRDAPINSREYSRRHASALIGAEFVEYSGAFAVLGSRTAKLGMEYRFRNRAWKISINNSKKSKKKIGAGLFARILWIFQTWIQQGAQLDKLLSLSLSLLFIVSSFLLLFMIKSVGKRLSLGGRKNNAPSRPERILEWLEAIVDSPPHARPDEAARQAHETPVLVPGETILHTVPSVGFWHGKECQSPEAAFVGTLFVTNFALRLNYFSRVDECMSFAPCSIRIPLAAICRLEFSKRRHQHCFKFFSVFSRDFFAGNLAFFRDD